MSLAVLVGVMAMSATLVGQLFVPTGRDTLRGLPGVEVLVEPVQAELGRVGLSTEAVTRDVSAQLAAARITVYANQRDNPSLSKPYLYVHLNGVPADGGSYAVGVQVHVRQTLASLTTESKVVDAMSWDAHHVVVSRSAGIGDAVRAEVRSLVERFVEDWRAVH